MSLTESEIASQPDIWERAAALAGEVAERLPAPGSRTAFIGCGTSYFMGQAAALRREQLGQGEGDAFVASEWLADRRYDAVVAISRSGTTTEVVRALAQIGAPTATLTIGGVAGTPVVTAADDAVVMDFADERSVVQTRFATAVLALLRTHAGDDIADAVEAARASLAEPLELDPAAFEHFVFLGRGWSIGIANEAALKFREASLAWTESYAAMDYRHGPISVAGERSLVWMLDADDALARDIAATGATVRVAAVDPMAELVTIQRCAVALAAARGLDPDNPRHLTRSVQLP